MANVTLNDVLLEIREVKGDVKNMLKSFEEHKADDKANFADSQKDIESIKKDVVWVQRIAFGAIGAYFFLQLLIQFGAFRPNGSLPNSYYSGAVLVAPGTPNVVGNSNVKGEGRLA